MTNSNAYDQESLCRCNSENQLTEPSQISNEIQVWTQKLEQKNDRITKMREEIDNTFETILREIKNNKSVSTATNPRSETNENQDTQQSGSKTNKSIGCHASNNVYSDLEHDHLLRASNMNELRNPAEPFHQNELDLDERIISNEDSEQEVYHSHELYACRT